MMFKARLRRVLAGALAAALALTATVPAHADTPTYDARIVSAESTVTVHVYDNNNADPDPSDMGSGSSVDTGSFGNLVKGATIGYYKVGELVQYTANDSTSLKYAVSADAVAKFGWQNQSVLSDKTFVQVDGFDYYLLDASELSGLLSGATSSDLKTTNGVTWTPVKDDNSDGTIDVGTIDGGLYLFIGSEMPSHTTKEIAPFFVSAPMPGTGGWNTNIHVYPKVQTANEMQIAHNVKYQRDADSEYVSSMSADSSTMLEYQITVTVPQNIKNLEEISVTDTLPRELSLDNNSGTLSVTGVSLNPSEYALSSNGSTVSFSIDDPTVLKKFDDDAQGSTITITYQAMINTSASLATPIESTATLSYEFNVFTGKSVDATATVYTYGIDLTKTFDDSAFHSGATFVLYTNDSLTEAVKVEEVGGTYWVDSDGTPDPISANQLNAGATGGITIKGLATGTYYLKETAAPDGYGKIQDPITIVVNKGTEADLATAIQSPTASVNGAQATIAAFGEDKAGLVQLTVENQKLLFGFLPQTGDTGTLIATAAGIGMIALAIIFVAGRRSKSSAR